ncbi:MAG TPA: pyrroline-5-carboxylate reductase [Nitrospiraceae bacterium]|nr:pyrroline-5-carboxylate reductase [Nitrospiraceae bacterium]
MLLDKRIALIGAGNMTEALVAGMLVAGVAHPDQLFATDILPERRTHFQDRYKIKVGGDNVEAARYGQVIILSVEPQVLDEVLDSVNSALQGERLIISVAAGYPISRIAAHLKTEARIVRAMPNTPSSVLAGVTALSFGPHVAEEDQQVARIIFESVGKVVVVEERLMDAVTGLSGSGPAYVYLMIEALADGGVKMGLSRQVAELLTAQTVLGAARMLIESGEHPGRLKDRVASPGGTTIAGIHKLEEGHLRATLIAAVEAATKRSQELGTEGVTRH